MKPFTAEQRAESFWRRVDKSAGPDACWPWQGVRRPQGYGRFKINGTYKTAHRIAFALVNHELAPEQHLDHLCRNPACVNPAHLEPVTQRENTLRGIGRAALNARKTHCPNGHEYTPDNIYQEGRRRRCVICHKERSRKAWPRKAARRGGSES